jgi:hypothetical protein
MVKNEHHFQLTEDFSDASQTLESNELENHTTDISCYYIPNKISTLTVTDNYHRSKKVDSWKRRAFQLVQRRDNQLKRYFLVENCWDNTRNLSWFDKPDSSQRMKLPSLARKKSNLCNKSYVNSIKDEEYFLHQWN